MCGQTGIISGEDDKYERLVEGCNAQVLDFPGPKSLLRLGGPGGGGGSLTYMEYCLHLPALPASYSGLRCTDLENGLSSSARL